ncbi:hypothetical protein CPB84DRAFT_1685331 [Gymnopilus junonius]|uniref:BTB domain-containing protein n=1 Tax=Gymnopilus junonius TaxID=109634 RepID=A0A9P5TJN7_GYMJU|nr:hypothetical protein CPB84DRAFT_1685331 [Gymnopilus junonius]
MVHLYILNPAHKLHFMSRLFLKGSKRILKQVNASPINPGISQAQEGPAKRSKVNVLDLIKADLPSVPQSALTRDTNYYKDESGGGFCIFRVENTLFKVHKYVLQREPSAFGDMFCLPVIPGNREGMSDDTAIPLTDTAEQFQDLLWALYALPTELYSTSEVDSPSLERLLNITELTHKYCIASFEKWALDRLFSLAQDPYIFLRRASPEHCARVLKIAALCNYTRILDAVTQQLIPRILWSDMNRQAILRVAESRGLRRIQGVVHYKDLINMEKASISAGQKLSSYPSCTELRPQTQERLIAAHHSLINLWECVKSFPPHFMEHDCPTHLNCLSTWSDLWLDAAEAQQTERLPTADVLGRLKAMMIILKKATRESETITLGCTLAALESITSFREDIIAGLMDHFQYY